MTTDEFKEVQAREWTPVELIDGSVPRFLRRMPAEVVFKVLASGESNVADPDMLVGGIDVYRYAPDDPVPLNKDWYAVYPDPDASLRVCGPFKDSEHWIDALPRRYQGVEVLGRTIEEDQ